MLQVMARNWWMLAVRGVAAILFGIALFIWPVIFIPLFAAYALVDGVFGVINGIRDRETNASWWLTVLEGVVGIIAGIGVLLMPPETVAVILGTVIGVWAIFTGVMEVIAAIQLRKEIEGEWVLGLTGILSIVFGIFALITPIVAFFSVLWLVSAYAIVFGVLMIILAFRLRGMQDTGATPTRAAA